MKQIDGSLEQLSAMADGHLAAEDLAQAVGAVAESEALRASWHTYHLVGEVLRSGAHSPCSDAEAFVARLRQRMAQEGVRVQPSVPVVVAMPAARTVIEAANEPVFRWKLVAGVASIAAAAAIGWNWIGAAPASSGPQLALQQVPAPTMAGQGTQPGSVLTRH